MKKILLIFFCFVTILASAQVKDKIVLNSIKETNTDKNNDNDTIEFTRDDQGYITPNYTIANFSKISNAFSTDVLSYFNLHYKYNTPLKIALFKETDEYKQRVTELKNIRNAFMNNYTYIECYFTVSDYNLSNNIFTINLGDKEVKNIFLMNDQHSNYYYFPTLKFNLKQNEHSLDYIKWKKYEDKKLDMNLLRLGIKPEKHNYYVKYDRFLYLKMMDKKAALAFENNRNNLDCYLIFKPIGIKSEYITSNKVKLVIFDNQTGEIYFQKTYFEPIIYKNIQQSNAIIDTMHIFKAHILNGKKVSGEKEEEEETSIENTDTVHTYEMPEFPGGEEAMWEYLGKNINYPPLARNSGIEGKVILTFEVGTYGEITQTEQVGKKLGYGCDEAAIYVVESMPCWKPAKINGKTVPFKHTISITFRLK
jgi:TonB family protein